MTYENQIRPDVPVLSGESGALATRGRCDITRIVVGAVRVEKAGRHEARGIVKVTYLKGRLRQCDYPDPGVPFNSGRGSGR